MVGIRKLTLEVLEIFERYKAKKVSNDAHIIFLRNFRNESCMIILICKENNWYNLYIQNKWANLGNFGYSINPHKSEIILF